MSNSSPYPMNASPRGTSFGPPPVPPPPPQDEYTRSAPPPPPPKNQYSSPESFYSNRPDQQHESNQIRSPPPPPQNPHGQTQSPLPQSQYQQQQIPTLSTSNIQPGWVPDILHDKSKSDLADLLNNPTLLRDLILNPETTHPAYLESCAALNDALTNNEALAKHVSQTAVALTTMRDDLTPRILKLHALERQWRQKQNDVDDALSPWSVKAVHGKLVTGIAEQQALIRALEESFLDSGGTGEMDSRERERECWEWTRRYREAVKLGVMRKEKRARLEEGRVGGWA